MRFLISGGLALFGCAAIPALADTAALAAQPIGAASGTKVVWLLIKAGYSESPAYVALPTGSSEQCETAGAEFLASKRINHSEKLRGFECLEGIR